MKWNGFLKALYSYGSIPRGSNCFLSHFPCSKVYLSWARIAYIEIVIYFSQSIHRLQVSLIRSIISRLELFVLANFLFWCYDYYYTPSSYVLYQKPNWCIAANFIAKSPVARDRKTEKSHHLFGLGNTTQCVRPERICIRRVRLTRRARYSATQHTL